MARQRHLKNAPITEALIDIQVTPAEGLSYAHLKSVIAAAGFGYYMKGDILEGTFAFKLPTDGKSPETTGDSRLVGVRMHSEDEHYVAQWRVNGLTLSRLPPYEDWGRLVTETRRIWDIYLSLLNPLRVVRIATRFINNLRLPLEAGATYQMYVNKLIDVPEEAPQGVANFLQRFGLVDVGTGTNVNLTLALNQQPTAGQVPVMLDVDAFKLTNIDPGDIELWGILDCLHDLKNRVFFGTITEKAAELYE